MHEQKNLFDRPFKLETGTREVPTYTIDTITVNGARFDLDDLHEALEGVDAGDSLIVSSKMCELLRTLEVFGSCGSRRNALPATPGRRFKEFFELVHTLWKEGLGE